MFCSYFIRPCRIENELLGSGMNKIWLSLLWMFLSNFPPSLLTVRMWQQWCLLCERFHDSWHLLCQGFHDSWHLLFQTFSWQLTFSVPTVSWQLTFSVSTVLWQLTFAVSTVSWQLTFAVSTVLWQLTLWGEMSKQSWFKHILFMKKRIGRSLKHDKSLLGWRITYKGTHTPTQSYSNMSIYHRNSKHQKLWLNIQNYNIIEVICQLKESWHLLEGTCSTCNIAPAGITNCCMRKRDSLFVMLGVMVQCMWKKLHVMKAVRRKYFTGLQKKMVNILMSEE